MNERYELKEFNRDLFRINLETGETVKLSRREWQGRNASEQFSQDYFKRIEEPPAIEAEEENEEKDETDEAA